MTGTNLALVVWGSFTWVLDRSELAVTKYSSLCAIWSPMKWMFWGNVVLLPVASLVRVWVRVFDHPEDEMANSLLPQFLLPPSCRRDKCPWVVCFCSSHPKCSVQERAHGEVDWFCTKPSTVWRERQRSCLEILLNCSFQWPDTTVISFLLKTLLCLGKAVTCVSGRND